MKTKTFISAVLFLTCTLLYGQNINLNRLQGSWMGDIIVPGISPITVIMNIKVKDNQIKGTSDCPIQGAKNHYIDSIWVVNDSIFTDQSTMCGPGAMFKGMILPGDSVIDGKWFQRGGQFPLKYRPTNYVYTRKSNLNPKFEGYKIIKLIESTPTKDQQQTGACWAFATTSFIETEAIRLGKKSVVLSPMFVDRAAFVDRAERYIRSQDSRSFGEGDLTFSALRAYKNFGAVPEAVYPGKIDTSSVNDHYKMTNVLSDKVKYYVENGYGKMTSEGYRKAIEDILYKYMGKAPESFNYEGKKYTTKSFAEERIGINPDDYFEITSYSHHPFYSKFVLETGYDLYLNLPINDFIKVIDNALLKNYSLCWDGDIREGYKDGFSLLKKDTVITQAVRQRAFDNYTTQDIHNMHIIGMAENSKGQRFYIIKNSSDYNNCGGYMYMSREYLLLKTISVMVHKDAIPKEIKNKLFSVL